MIERPSVSAALGLPRSKTAVQDHYNALSPAKQVVLVQQIRDALNASYDTFHGYDVNQTFSPHCKGILTTITDKDLVTR